MKEISTLDGGSHLDGGLGNFRFCSSTRVGAVPFFPGARAPPAHADDRVSFAIGLENGNYARLLLEEAGNIDAVTVSTPDHTHAAAAMLALKAGKHVYCQKPLARTVGEVRALKAEAAKRPKQATQMGNQGHSMEGTRRINELIAANAIGPVREVHVWTDRPLGYWAQGIPRPQAQGASAGPADLAARQAWNQRTVDQAVLKYMSESPTAPPDWKRTCSLMATRRARLARSISEPEKRSMP